MYEDIFQPRKSLAMLIATAVLCLLVFGIEPLVSFICSWLDWPPTTG